MQERSEAAFESAVLAARIGYVTAMDQRAASRWDNSRRQRVTSEAKPALAGEALDAALRMLAWQHRDLVAVVPDRAGFDALRADELDRLRAARLMRDKR